VSFFAGNRGILDIQSGLEAGPTFMRGFYMYGVENVAFDFGLGGPNFWQRLNVINDDACPQPGRTLRPAQRNCSLSKSL